MYIDSAEKLQKLCETLPKADIVCFDTEFMREKTFYPILCLIQLKFDGKAYAIDPLKLDVKPLFEILVKAKTLVCHSGRQDFEVIYNLIGKLPKNVFDTQVAAMVAGLGEQMGYQQLVHDLLSKKVDKTERYTDWAARPLSDAQIEYALTDVEHLEGIYDALSAKINKANRQKWLENQTASLLAPQNFMLNEADAWQKIKHREKKNCNLGVLQEVAKWRELRASLVNRPRKRIMTDEALMEIALRKPQTKEALLKIRNIGGINDDIAKQILSAVKAGLEIPDENKPKLKPRPKKDVDGGALDLLKILLKIKCDEKKVAPRLVASSEDLVSFLQGGKPAFLEGWQYETFGKAAQELVEGKIKFGIENNILKVS